MYSNFLLGELRVTGAAKVKLQRVPLDLIARHAVNDHGRITPREQRRNAVSMKTTGEIISRYPIDPRAPELGMVEVVTDAEWGSTTARLENE